MDIKRLSFEVDGDQIDFKSYAKKDFLELSIKAISDVNPNRNQSWFTTESLQKAVESNTCKNKPVLGYFENDDFVSHNGSWKQDKDTGVSYWDTLGSKGERILGVIREQDNVETLQDSQGRTWLCFNAVLWVQYSYKQVKRLLKDAKKAKQNGGPTKNVSVEVDITSWEELDNGVMKINEFNLVGVTILGSRNGIKVEPGIEDADLSVVDMMGRDVYDKQMQGLRMAYEKLDEPTIDDSAKNKEEFKVENEVINNFEENNVTAENSTGLELADQNKEPVSDSHKDFEEGENCPDCGKNPCECESKKCEEETPKACEESKCEHEEDHDNDDHKEEDPEEDPEDDDKKEPEEGCGQEPEHQQKACSCDECENEKRDVIHDLAWLISDCHWNIESLNDTMEYYQNSEEPHKEYILNVLNRIVNAQKGFEQELGALLGRIAEEIPEEEIEYEAKLAQYSDVSGLIKNYENSVKEVQELKDQVDTFKHKEFLLDADAMIKSAFNLSEEDSKEFFDKCQAKEITDLETLKTQIAIKVFDATKQPVESTTSASFVADVYNPTVSAESKPVEKLDRWGRMRKNVNK